MALTPTIQSSQAGAIVVVDLKTDAIHASQAGVMAVANFPTPEMDVSQAGIIVATNFTSTKLRVSQAGVMAVARGRVYNPKLRAWPYTLDAHDMYALRLGEGKTLIFDLLTGQWSWFSSGDFDFWRPNIGVNWYTAGGIPEQYGSNVLCGDDTFGHLWILNPEQGYDDKASNPTEETERFPRVATGQLAVRQRGTLPVYSVFLTADFGNPVAAGDAVLLEYSNDLGRNYVTAGEKIVVEGNFSQRFDWRSLGSITQAGRLFKISDDGAFARIDSLDCDIGGVDE